MSAKEPPGRPELYLTQQLVWRASGIGRPQLRAQLQLQPHIGVIEEPVADRQVNDRQNAVLFQVRRVADPAAHQDRRTVHAAG